MNSKFYKCCAVPQCTSTTFKTPEKLFIRVPCSKNKRKIWLQLAGRDPSLVATDSKMHFCEDHFDLPNDMENYTEYHVMGSVSQVRMRADCLPTKFGCQPNRKKRTDNETTEPLAVKRQRLEIIAECERDIKQIDVPNLTVKLQNDIDVEVSESQFHSELKERLPAQKQPSDIFSNLCRSCAKQSEDLIPIETITSVGTSVIAIFNEIGLTISEDDEFPKKLCKMCLEETTMVYKFYKKILNSKSVFERLLLEKNSSESVNVKKENDTFSEKEEDDDDDDDNNNLELMQIDENDPLYECCFQKMCSICGMKQLQAEDQLLEHQLSQHVPVSNQENYNIMTCPYCKTEFSIMLWYDEHLEKCLGQLEPNQCMVCKLFVQPNDLDDHLRDRHMLEKINSDSFRCIAFERCTYISSSVLMLNEHQMAEHDKSLYVCIDCGSDFIASKKLIVHRRTHVKELLWCSKCDVVFTDNKTKKRHWYSVHRKTPNKKVCQICGKLCFSEHKHNNVYDTTSKKYCCDKCSMKFSTLNCLKQHQIIHDDIKPFNCSECGASFNQQASLVYHMKQHTGEDLLICSVCSQKFDKASKLTAHMEVHTKAGENPHQCHLCQRVFTHAARLKVHLSVHKTDDENAVATSSKNST